MGFVHSPTHMQGELGSIQSFVEYSALLLSDGHNSEKNAHSLRCFQLKQHCEEHCPVSFVPQKF